MKIEQTKRCGRHVGRKELIKHLEGHRLTQRKAIQAKCFECMGGYIDGAYDCNIPDCALYPLMPYKGKTPNSCPPTLSQHPIQPNNTPKP